MLARMGAGAPALGIPLSPWREPLPSTSAPGPKVSHFGRLFAHCARS